MRIPKSLTDHPAVESVETAETNGSDCRYVVRVKPGYFFTVGHAAGCSGSIGVDTVREFLYAAPRLRNEA